MVVHGHMELPQEQEVLELVILVVLTIPQVASEMMEVKAIQG